MNKKNNIAMVSSAILAVFAAVQVHAGTTIYHEGDLLVSFRAASPAASGAGSKDLTVDLGNVNTFVSSTYSQGGTVDLTSYLSGVDFTSLFGGATVGERDGESRPQRESVDYADPEREPDLHRRREHALEQLRHILPASQGAAD